jgi:hypothetical protein
MNRFMRALTILELIISIVLLSVIVLGLATIDTFSAFHVRSSEQRAKLQLEASTALEHMTKQISVAIGNEIINGSDTVVSSGNILFTPGIRAYIDANGNGQQEVFVPGFDHTGVDHWVAYRFTGSAGANPFQIRYCPDCFGSACMICNVPWANNIVARRISNFAPIKPSDPLQDNFVIISVTACWDPTQPAALGNCGTSNNPDVDLTTTIRMPSVSTN